MTGIVGLIDKVINLDVQVVGDPRAVVISGKKFQLVDIVSIPVTGRLKIKVPEVIMRC